MITKLNSDILVGGYLTVIREDPITGLRTSLGRYTNITTTAYKTRLLTHMISPVSSPDVVPTSMDIGTGVVVPAASDTGLSTFLLNKVLNNIPVVAGNSIVYEIRLEVAEANTLITEVGLKTGDNQLVARVITSVNKTSLDIIILQFTKTLL